MVVVYRPPNRLRAQQEADAKRRLQQEQDGSPIPISNVGGGRGGALIAFTEGTGKVSP